MNRKKISIATRGVIDIEAKKLAEAYHVEYQGRGDGDGD